MHSDVCARRGVCTSLRTLTSGHSPTYHYFIESQSFRLAHLYQVQNNFHIITHTQFYKRLLQVAFDHPSIREYYLVNMSGVLKINISLVIKHPHVL